MKKQILTLSALLLFTATAYAESPEKTATNANLNQMIEDGYKSQAALYKDFSRLLDEVAPQADDEVPAIKREVASFAETVVASQPAPSTEMVVQLLPK